MKKLEKVVRCSDTEAWLTLEEQLEKSFSLKEWQALLKAYAIGNGQEDIFDMYAVMRDLAYGYITLNVSNDGIEYAVYMDEAREVYINVCTAEQEELDWEENFD